MRYYSMQPRMTVGANLYRLIYNLLNAIVFPTYFAIS